MSQEQAAAVYQAMTGICNDCGHPLDWHAGDATGMNDNGTSCWKFASGQRCPCMVFHDYEQRGWPPAVDVLWRVK